MEVLKRYKLFKKLDPNEVKNSIMGTSFLYEEV